MKTKIENIKLYSNKEGTVIISEMSDQHLLNAIKYYEKLKIQDDNQNVIPLLKSLKKEQLSRIKKIEERRRIEEILTQPFDEKIII